MCRAFAVVLLLRAALAAADGPCAPPDVALSGGGALVAERQAEEWRLSLRAADGQTVVQRVLPGDLACTDVRAAMRAIADTWELSLAPAPLSVPALPPPPSAVVVAPVVAPAPRLPWHLDLDAALVGAASSAGVAPAGLISAALLSGASRFGASLSVFGEGVRQVALGAGGCAFDRFGAGLGPVYRQRWGALSLELGLDAWASLLTATGVDQPNARSATAVDLGLSARAQLLEQLGAWAPFAGVWGFGWAPDTAAISNAGLTATIPSWELLLGIGVRFGSG